jgi:hypothetical protein
MSVNIIGNRDLFLSKGAILRLKADIKENKQIDPKKYIKDGYIFNIEQKDGNHNVYIKEFVQVEEEPEPLPEPKVENKEDLRKKLKQQLRDSRKDRSGENKRALSSMKSTVPTKILDCYTNLVSKYKLDNLPRPDEVIKNVDKYKLQISAVMGKIGKISDDPRVSKSVLAYFTALGNHLNIEPMDLSNGNMETIANMAAMSQGVSNSKDYERNNPTISRMLNNDDTEDEDEAN